MKIQFAKLVASGNDFVLLDLRRHGGSLDLKKTAKIICHRKLGIGADGLLVLERSKKADVKMRIFNADGSEAEMCGNGARCVVYFLANDAVRKIKGKVRVDTKAGVLKAESFGSRVKINMTNPKSARQDLKISLNRHQLKLNFINTGVPHAVILCEDIEKINVYSLGRLIRFHKRFKPAGANVNFVEPVGLNRIKIRTYERGVEEETLACGTGSVAGAIIYALKLNKAGLSNAGKSFNIDVDTVSGETLKIYFDVSKNKVNNVWLQGSAKIICKGEVYV